MMILQKILYSKMNTSLCCIKNYQAINFKIWPLWSKILIHSSRHASRVNSDIPRSLMLRYDTKFRFGCQEIRTFCLCRSKKLNSYTILLRRKFCTNVKNEKAGIPEKYRRGEIKRLLSIATPEKWRIAGALFLLLISSSITILVPFSLGKVIDIIQIEEPTKMTENLKKLSLILLGLFFIGGLANFGRVFLISIAGQKMTKNLRQKVFKSLLNQELAFFDERKTGELVNRLSSDTLLVCQALTKNLSDGLRSGIMVLGGISVMFYMSPELALVGLSVVPPVAALAIVYGRFVKKLTREVQDSLAGTTSVAEEKISNIRTVKAFSHEKQEIEKYDQKLNYVLGLQSKEALARGVFFGLTGLSGNAITLTVLCYGGALVNENTMTIGNLTSFLLYAAYIGISIAGLSNFYSELNRSLGASVRLWEIIDRVPQISTAGMVPVGEPKGHILFQKVTFSYPMRRDIPVLKGLNLDIPEATVTAIVGPSGSGKSTIASILLRLYEPDSGIIFLDGVSIDQISSSWIRKHIGYVSQEPILFSGSIRENILYGVDDKNTVTEEQLIRATQEANCFDFIKNFPQGFETRVGERGIMLSGGQKQRIAIARALIKNPKILLLDEATSALDAESEHLVQEALEKIMQERTVLVIAHRLSSIKNSDQIIVLERGQVVEKGSYQSLMLNEEGSFKKLIKHQAFF